MMSVKDFFSQGWPTRLGFYVGKYSPPWAGHFIARVAARLFVLFKPQVYHDVFDNQRHVLGPDVSQERLEEVTHRVFFNAFRAYYEVFHNVGQGHLDVREFTPPVRMDPQAMAHLREALGAGRGLFILGCHMGNFDLGGVALSQYMPVDLQVLSLADPPGGFEFFNKLRAKAGVVVTPISTGALRGAISRLREAGAVITGVDRPVQGNNEPVEFFGATAYLPTGYMRIPLRTESLIMTATAFREGDEYRIVANPAMELERTGDEERDVAVNVRRVLEQIEGFIRVHPEQWLMFTPVWRRSR
jgi:KDO2-lipid IV(A) lauroyltransferase